MATERTRARRTHPYQRSEPAWHKGPAENTAALRFPRDQLLALFRSSDMPVFLVPAEELADVTLQTSAQPASTAGTVFSHNLGEELNSRERQTKLPDWFPLAEGQTLQDFKPKDPIPIPAPEVLPLPAFKPTEPSRPLKIVLDPKAVVRNLPRDLEVLALPSAPEPVPREDVFEERYSTIDVEMEKKLKAQEEEDEEMPEWAESAPEKTFQSAKRTDLVVSSSSRPRRFSIQLLTRQVASGDPFAQKILDSGIPDSQGFTHLEPYSLPMEKTWYYKDPQQQVQGPFSTIEMYSWNVMGYFPAQLQVAWRSPVDFKPLTQFQRDAGHREEPAVVSGLFEKFTGEVAQKPANAKTVGEIERNSNKWGKAYEAQFPTFSQKGDSEAAAALKSMLGMKPETKPTAWGSPAKPQAKSLAEIQKEEKAARR